MSKQMTLEQVRDECRKFAVQALSPSNRDWYNGVADAIDAHLNAANGEVAWWCAIESVEAIDGTEEIAMSWNADDGNTGEAARTEANQWINDQPHPGNFRLAKIYAHPVSPDLVLDAERLRFIQRNYQFAVNTCGGCIEDGINLENEHIDAAMAALDGGE